jgi:anti-anti-sigma regulatory factor
MTIVELPADLGIESATDLKQLLLPAVDIDTEVQLDGQAVSRLHCASLQLLAAFVMARSQGKRPTRINASQALTQALGLLGLQALLDDATTSFVH